MYDFAIYFEGDLLYRNSDTHVVDAINEALSAMLGLFNKYGPIKIKSTIEYRQNDELVIEFKRG